MKHYATYALSLLLCCLTITAFSQNSAKPKQFASYPEKIKCSEQELARIFTSSPGQQIRLSFSDNFTFSGNVTSNIVKYANLQTAVIISPDYYNTIFSVSRITNDDGTLSYIGRIINQNYFDGFELKKDPSGNYQLKKIETDKVIQGCRQL